MSAHAHSPSTVHDLYLSALPAVASAARRRFGHLPAVDREEAVAEAIAAGFIACLSLVRRGRAEQVRTAGFASNAARAVAGGRRVGNGQPGCDMLSALGRRRHERQVVSLDAESEGEESTRGWLHEAVEGRRMAIPDKVALRVDGGAWLASLSERDRAIVAALAAGERASTTTRCFSLSPARLSQLRREWALQWQRLVEVAL